MSVKFLLVHEPDMVIDDKNILRYIGCYPELSGNDIDASIAIKTLHVENQENDFNVSFLNVMDSNIDEDTFLFIFDLNEINPSIVNESLSKIFSTVCGDVFSESHILEWKHDLIKNVISWDNEKDLPDNKIHSAVLNTNSLHYKSFSGFIHNLSKATLTLI